MSDIAWYWGVLLTLGWVAIWLALLFTWIGVDRHRWISGLLCVVWFVAPPTYLVAWSWLDDDSGHARCEAAGGIVVVTPAQGRACIDRSAVIPESEWRD